MGGALLQLAAVGEQNIKITGNPNISYFKTVYKRHTNFSIDTISQYFKETPNFGTHVFCSIDRKGDLLSGITLQLEIPALQTNISWINGIGHHIIKEVSLYIGGEVITTLTGEYIDIYREYTTPAGKRDTYYKLTGKYSSYTRNTNETANTLFIPLPFWFCKNIGDALPLVSLQYMDVKIGIKFRPFDECWYSGTAMSITPTTQSITDAKLLCDFVYLDTFERRKFAQMAELEYLIEQVQLDKGYTVQADAKNNLFEFYFNHTVKALYWVYQATATATTNDWGNFSKTLDDDSVIQTPTAPLSYCKLIFNGHDRTEKLDAEFFRLLQAFKYHSACNISTFVYMYSFCINPENTQPCGVCNFSRIDATQMEIEFASSIPLGELKFYAVNYNVLKIKNGMAGILYSS